MVTDLDLTAGALLVGVLITAVGYGITMTQTYMYMTRFPEDPWYVRWTVWTLFGTDTAHIAFTWHMVYHYLISNFSNEGALEDAVWSFSASIVITAIITSIAHCFYARRILIRAWGKWHLPLLVLVLSVIRLVSGFIACAQIRDLKTFHFIKHGTLVTVVIGLGSGTLADCVITASLVYVLQTHKSELSPYVASTGILAIILIGIAHSLWHYVEGALTFKPSVNSILDRIAYWAVNNGLLTCVVGIAFLVTQFAPMPANMVFIALHMLLSKLYANSLLATLNSRVSQCPGRGIDTTMELNSPIMFSTVIPNPRSRSAASPPSGGTSGVVFSADKDAEHACATSHDEVPILHISAPAATRANPRYAVGDEAVWRPADGVTMVRQLGYNWG